MRFHLILNSQGGSLRTVDIDAFAKRAYVVLEQAGHHVSFEIVAGAEIEAALDKAASDSFDVIMVGGGDGTVSAAAGRLMDTQTALAILPAGTMNLFARSLAIPLSLDEAVAAFANGRVRAVDLASANGRVFVHQFSIGLHAELIRLREKRLFRSRLGKIWASLRAGVNALFRPPRLKLKLVIDETSIVTTTAAVGISNNLFGEGHLPYADDPDGGVLGVYVTSARRRRDLLHFVVKMARGRWKTNRQVEIYQAKEVTLTLLSRQRRFGCAIDGELCDLEDRTILRTHPGALKVLVPAG